MVFRNTLAHTVGYLTGYVLSFVLAPIMLARLGLEQFGIWAVTGALATYAGLLDLGVTRSVERFVALFHTRGQRRAVAEMVTLGIIAVAIVTTVAGIAAFAAAPALADALDDVLTASEMRVVLLCSVAIFALMLLRSVISAVALGMLEMVPPNVAFVIFNVVNFVVSVTVLIVDPDLVTYAIANVASGLVGLAVTIVAVRRVWSPMRLALPTREVTGEVLRFGLMNQVVVLSEMVHLQLDKVIIAFAIGVKATAAYEVASRAMIALRSVAAMSVSAMVPTATTEIAAGGDGVVQRFYRHYTTRATSLSLPLVVFAAVSAPALIVAWLGDVPEDTVAIFAAITLAQATNLSTGVGTTISLGEGRAGLLAAAAVSATIVNISLTIALTGWLGIWGVVSATIAGVLVGDSIFLAVFHRRHRMSIRVFAAAVAPPLALSALAAVPALALALVAPVENGDRLGGIIASLICAATFLAIYWPLASRLDILPERLRLRRGRRPVALKESETSSAA